MKKHNTKTLPKWAQKIIEKQNAKITELSIEVGNLRKITRRLDKGEGEWFALFHPQLAERKGPINLFTLRHNASDCVCSLGEYDFIMVCREANKI